MPKNLATQQPIIWQIPLKYLRSSQEWAYRAFIFGFGLLVGYLGVTDNHSLMYAAGQERDGIALIVLIVLASLMGIADMVLNGNDRNWVPCLKRQRHHILWALSFCFMAQLFVAYDSVRSNGVALFYLWPGIFTMVVAVRDARKRRVEKCADL